MLLYQACAWSLHLESAQLLGPRGCYGERMHKCTKWVHVTRWEGRASLSLGYIISVPEKDQALFQNNQSTSQSFVGFWWVLPLTNPLPRSPGSFVCYPVWYFDQSMLHQYVYHMGLLFMPYSRSISQHHLDFYWACVQQKNFSCSFIFLQVILENNQ